MADLWNEHRRANREAAEPLAARMRPRTLEEFVGQEHFLGPGKLLRRMLEADRLTSVIFFGPPGTGKTTLARLIAAHTQRHFEQGNAASAGVKQVREVLDAARRRLEEDGRRTIYFLDEIHRFSRSQQDVLLGDVERGIVTLIGATTENPFFTVNSALVSRSQLFQFEPLNIEQIHTVIRRAIADPQRGYGELAIQISDEAIELWAQRSDGDARRALAALEVAVLSGGRDQTATGGDGPDRPLVIDLATAAESMQTRAVVYDRAGDQHYDAASALIKSMRGSDPDAAVYWLARMLEGGEDPRFIARRVAILASEDIGNADPRAIEVAAAAYTLTERVGMPECQLTLGQAVIYMALAPKSNASALAIWGAMKDVKEGRVLPVPRHLRDSHYAGSEKLGHGEGYIYDHQRPGGVSGQDYLGVEKRYYVPTDRGMEQRIGEYLERLRQMRRQKGGAGADTAGADSHTPAAPTDGR